jgi:hypothetical protein
MKYNTEILLKKRKRIERKQSSAKNLVLFFINFDFSPVQQKNYLSRTWKQTKGSKKKGRRKSVFEVQHAKLNKIFSIEFFLVVRKTQIFFW